MDFPGGTVVKNLPSRRRGFDHWVRESLEKEMATNPFLYSCLENSMDRGTWHAIVHGMAKSQTQLSSWAHPYLFINWCYSYFMLLPILLLLFYFSAIQHTHTLTHKNHMLVLTYYIDLTANHCLPVFNTSGIPYNKKACFTLLLCSAVRHQCAGEDFFFLAWLLFPQGSWFVLGWCKSIVVLHGWNLLSDIGIHS